MNNRTSIIRLNVLSEDDLTKTIRGNPELMRLITTLRRLTPPEIDAWKESVRQSRLHDWEDHDDTQGAGNLPKE